MKTITVSEYILHRLKELNCNHIFGVPGTSCSDFYDFVAADEQVHTIVTTNELEAGYAADGYARYRGLGTLAVSYGVGTLSLANAIAGALVERSPVLVLNGGPSVKDVENERNYGVLFSHSTGRSQSDLKVFQEVTIASSVLNNRVDIPKKIDALLLEAINRSGPVYLEVPHHLWKFKVPAPATMLHDQWQSSIDEGANAQFIKMATELVQQAKKPVVYIGAACVRFNLHTQIQEMLEANNIPYATTVLAKSILKEDHPLYLGTYDTDLVVKPVRTQLEESDCLIALGCIFGVDQLTLIKKQYSTMVNLSFDEARIGTRHFENIDLATFINGFRLSNPRESLPNEKVSEGMRHAVDEEPELTQDTLFSVVNHFIKRSTTDWQTVLDTCLGSFLGADLHMKKANTYLANPVWLSIGHGTPAALGSYCANGLRPVILTGDGGFQMVVQTISSFVKYNIPAVIIILDNGTYAIEQFLIDPCYFEKAGIEPMPLPYVDLHSWNYEKMPELFAGGSGFRVRTNKELLTALQVAESTETKPVIIAASLKTTDIPAYTYQHAEDECKRRRETAEVN